MKSKCAPFFPNTDGSLAFSNSQLNQAPNTFYQAPSQCLLNALLNVTWLK